MRDQETGSEWAHLLGRAMAGQLKGKELRPLVTDMVTWKSWKESHPQTTVLNMSRTAREFSRDFYEDESRFVFGFVVAGQPWALPMEKMSRQVVQPLAIEDRRLVATFDAAGAGTYLFSAVVDGQALEFERFNATSMRDRSTGTQWSLTNGQAIQGPLQGKQLEQQVGIMSFRKAWRNFHPNSKDVPFD